MAANGKNRTVAAARAVNPRSRGRALARRCACGVAALALVAAAIFSSRSLSFAQAPTESQVKAAYLFNFLKFVEWPDDPGQDPRGKWVVGFVGDSLVSDELAKLADGKSVLGRDLQVKKLQASDNLRACHILFISDSEKKRVPSILAVLHGSSVLTVADMSDFVGSGGMVQFVVEDARVRVAIDVDATTHARLKVSSKLLALAHVVSGIERGANN